MRQLNPDTVKPQPARWLIASGALVLLLLAYVCFQLSFPTGTSDAQKQVESQVETDIDQQGDSQRAVSPTANADVLPTLQAAVADDSLDGLVDPRNDGWISEAFADQAKLHLKELFKQQANTTADGDLEPRDAVTAELDSMMETVFDDGSLLIKRSKEAFPPEANDSVLPLTTVRAIISPLLDANEETSGKSPVNFHFKVVRVDLSSEKPQTTCLYEAGSKTQQRGLQQTAKIDCVWSDGTTDAKLESLKVRDLEEVRLTNTTWFSDCTESVLADVPAYQNQLGYGTNHWMQRIERAHGMDDSVRTGLAIGDANGDELDDVYVCQGPGLPNLLLVQNPDGTVKNCAPEAGVDWLDQTSSALFVDFDNDGDQDLAIATTGGLVVMANDGSGRFETRASLAEQMTDVQSLSAADYDLDGDVDLFLCAYRHQSGRQHGEFVFHDATSGGRNYLYRNDVQATATSWTFTDVTDDVGLGVGSTRYTLAGAWADYDNDGDSDLYIANDYGRNFLFQNNDGHFADVTSSAGLMDTGFGMSVDWGDHNRDGKMDLYIGNMFSSAGSRVTQQPGFQTNSAAEQRTLYRRMAQGNSLFQNVEGVGFRDISVEADVQMGRWAWSSVFADLNNDGWEDLVVANGYISTDDTGDL